MRSADFWEWKLRFWWQVVLISLLFDERCSRSSYGELRFFNGIKSARCFFFPIRPSFLNICKIALAVESLISNS